MSYSINVELHPYADAKQLHKIRLLVIYMRMKARYSLPFKIKKNQLGKGEVVSHPNKEKLNGWLKKERNDLEARLIDYLRYNKFPTAKELQAVVSNKTIASTGPVKTVQDLLHVMIIENKNTVSTGRLYHYASFAELINEFIPMWSFNRFTHVELARFHEFMIGKGYAANTIWSKFNILRTVRTQAIKRKLIQQDPFDLYRSPGYMQNVPVFMSEPELERFYKSIAGLTNERYKQVGYYFLLSAYTGYRISDLKRFVYDNNVKEERVILHTKKTGEIVSIIIHSKLKDVLKYCRYHRLMVSEPECNVILKTLAKISGFTKKITMHCGRHSFAMLLAEKGVGVDDAMELMGITNPATIKIYFKISNKRLDKVVMQALG